MILLTEIWLTALGWRIVYEVQVTPAGTARVRLDHWLGMSVYVSGPIPF